MRLELKQVEFIPETLAQGELYVSSRYATAVHLCACGCGSEVVTPLKPGRWRIQVHGGSASLFPSIGNWSFPCQSHYWIRNGEVCWAPRWSAAKIARARSSDASLMNELESEDEGAVESPPISVPMVQTPPVREEMSTSLWLKIKGWLK